MLARARGVVEPIVERTILSSCVPSEQRDQLVDGGLPQRVQLNRQTELGEILANELVLGPKRFDFRAMCGGNYRKYVALLGIEVIA